jgi:putative spermidine/putrescine transport system substrate-binding protein
MAGPDPLRTGDRRRLSRRALLGVAVGSLTLSGCVVDPPQQGPVVPTPTPGGLGGVGPAVDGPAGRWSGRELRVGAAGNDIAAAVDTVLLRPYAAATGCRITLGYADYGTLLDGVSALDLALVDERWGMRLSAARVLDRVGGIGSDGTVADLLPAGASTVPAYGNAIVSTYRLDAVERDRIPANWAGWWQSRKLPGNRTLAKGSFGTFEFALLADGVAPDELYPLDLDRAIGSLRRISGSIVDRWWETGPQVIDWLSNGRASFGSAMAHAVVVGERTGRPIQPVWNQGLLVSDCWVIPQDAGNRDVAADFIRFALSASAQATLAMTAALGPVSSAGLALVDPHLRGNLPTSPLNLPRLVRADSQWWADNEAAASRAFDSWLLGNPRE